MEITKNHSCFPRATLSCPHAQAVLSEEQFPDSHDFGKRHPRSCGEHGLRVDRSARRGGRSHLHQRLLHGGPVRHPPSALQHEVRVYVPLGLAILGQGLPLVQLLRAPADQSAGGGSATTKPESSGTVISFHPTQQGRCLSPEKGGLLCSAGLVPCKSHRPSKGATPRNTENCPLHNGALPTPEQGRGRNSHRHF